MFGLVQFNRHRIADEIESRKGWKVNLGRMNWQADSFHIYGKDIEAAEQRLFRRIEEGDLSERTYNFRDPLIQEIYREAEEGIRQKIEDYDTQHR
jgi:thymidylate synthase